MREDNTKNEEGPRGASNVIPLGQSNQLDLSQLSPADQNEMRRRYSEGKIELEKKATDLAIENQAMANRLDDMVDTVSRAADSGASATVTGAYTDKMGRTEIMIGNTETAAKGKLSGSQTGRKDLTLIYVIIAAIVIVIVAAIVVR